MNKCPITGDLEEPIKHLSKGVGQPTSVMAKATYHNCYGVYKTCYGVSIFIDLCE